MFLVHHRIPIILHDLGMVALAWALAVIIREGWPLLPNAEIVFWQILPIVLIVQSIVLWHGGLYQSIWRFTGMPDLAIILRVSFLGTFIIVLVIVGLLIAKRIIRKRQKPV